ncbi:hypothetical protein [Streptomyces katrae]|uniref:hypothetical protein n=1 Tax=Streptomyces katrae TaxID=68223 RepID=UPI000A79A200|nr:hypothetical protein [Streptomyces katrae]
MSRITRLFRRPAYRFTHTGNLLYSVPARPVHTAQPGADEIALRTALIRMGVGR